MQRYKDYAPTGCDSRGLCADRYDIGEYGVLLIHSRDSGILEESNWDCALRSLGGESDAVQVHRFGHWGCGWFELILVQPETPQWETALEIEASLENYPVLDEEDHSAREWQLRCDTWQQMSTRDRIEAIARYNAGSIFAARRDCIPDNNGGLDDYLRREC